MAKFNMSYNKSNEFGTPQDFYDFLNGIYGPFDLDVAASKENAKCEKYYTKEDNGKEQPWHGRVWCNPPYTNGSTKHHTEIYQWISKALDEIHGVGRRCMESSTFLLKADTSSKWFHDLVLQNEMHIGFVNGRLRFKNKSSKGYASFYSIVLHIDRNWEDRIYSIRRRSDKSWTRDLCI